MYCIITLLFHTASTEEDLNEKFQSLICEWYLLLILKLKKLTAQISQTLFAKIVCHNNPKICNAIPESCSMVNISIMPT